jgi:hypothetical protein
MRSAARKFSIEAIEALVAVRRDERAPAAVRVSAANAILDRGYGKAREGAEVNAPRGLDELLRELEEQRLKEMAEAQTEEASKDTLN